MFYSYIKLHAEIFINNRITLGIGDRSMTKLLFFIVSFFLLSVAVNALDFNFSISPEQKSIKTNESAVFKLTVNHNDKEDRTFEVFSSDVIWDVRSKDILRVSPSGLSTDLHVKPLNLNPGVYGVPIVVKLFGTNELLKKVVILEIKSANEKEGSYLPAVSGVLSLSKSIDPREEVVIDLSLENKNIKNIPSLDVKLRSRIINVDSKTSLGSLEKKKLTFKVQLDKTTPPQRDQLKATLFAFDEDRKKDYQFDLLPSDYEVIVYGTELAEDIKIKKQFLKTTKEIVLSNPGNVPLTKEYKINKKGVSSFFTSFDPKPKLFNEFYVWTVQLSVGESLNITQTTNYWSLFVLVVLILLAVLSYFLFRSPIVVSKSARIISTKEGGISELKVILHIRNRSGKKVRNVRVIDLIPNLAELVKHFDVGSLEPYKVVLHDAKGTIVKWKVDEVEPGEERLIYYKVKNKLSVLSGISLPAAVVKFETAPETERSSKSNVVCMEF